MHIHGKKLAVIGITAISVLLIFFAYQSQGKDKISAEQQTPLSGKAAGSITAESTLADQNTPLVTDEPSDTSLTAAAGNAAGITASASPAAVTGTPQSSPAPENITEAVKNDITKLIKKYYDTSELPGKNVFMTDEQASKELASIKQKREVIEKYKNIVTYIKPGLLPDTYVVFTTYNMKVTNIDTLVPGMSLLYITKNENGDLRVNNDTPDEQLNQLLTQLTKEDDIKSLIDKVNSDLKSAMAKDNSLKDFVKYLKSVS
jgi:hypothetical protein